MSTYYGRYKSTTSGCVKEFASQASSTMSFAPAVNYSCDLCKKTHGFKLSSTNVVSTPSQEKSFDQFCKSHFVERNVEVPVKK